MKLPIALLPALSLALAFALYLPLPAAGAQLARLPRALHARLARALTYRKKTPDPRLTLGLLLLLILAAGAFAGALPTLLQAVLCAPALGAIALLPPSAAVKRELDSGVLAHDTAAYEARVRGTCAALAPSFVSDGTAPLLLCALGAPLGLSVALVWAYAALRALCGEDALALRIVTLLLRPADAVLRTLLLLCTPLAGRSPFRITGRRARERLMSILGLADDGTQDHSPVAGDVTQGVFLCCLCLVLLCVIEGLALLTFAGQPLIKLR